MKVSINLRVRTSDGRQRYCQPVGDLGAKRVPTSRSRTNDESEEAARSECLSGTTRARSSIRHARLA